MRDEFVVVVIDDALGDEVDQTEPRYNQTAFREDYANLGYKFFFCSAWDVKAGDFTASTAIEYISSMSVEPDLILLDIRFGEKDLLGLEILQNLYEECPSVPVVIMTSTPKADLWEACSLSGAVDYLVKPIEPRTLKQTIDRYCGSDPAVWLIGQSGSFLSAVDETARASTGGVSSVLLLGPSGTGKELFAQFLHRHGPHHSGPFLAVHIPSISPQLIEAELFGYSKGAFTGAMRDEPGRLVQANGGVLFLDEIGDLTPVAQAALLRVIETREVTRLGDGRRTKLRIQVVAATNAKLPQMVKENEFRLDLYNRLATTVVRLPQLSERLDDLPMLLRHFLRRGMLERSLDPIPALLPEDLTEKLSSLAWYGNLRELWNFVQRVLDLAQGRPPSPMHFLQMLPSSMGGFGAEADNIEQPNAAIHGTLRQLPSDVVRNPRSFLEALRIQELSLLWSAMDLTRDALTGKPNRAKAVSLLKGRRCSTNEFDRWVRSVKDRVDKVTLDRISREFPEL